MCTIISGSQEWSAKKNVVDFTASDVWHHLPPPILWWTFWLGGGGTNFGWGSATSTSDNSWGTTIPQWGLIPLSFTVRVDVAGWWRGETTCRRCGTKGVGSRSQRSANDYGRRLNVVLRMDWNCCCHHNIWGWQDGSLIPTCKINFVATCAQYAILNKG